MPSLPTAIGLGIAFCALPGAVMVRAIRRGVERGFLAALCLQLGALIGVMLWAVVALLGTALLLQNQLARLAFGVAGGIVLLQLTWQAFRDAFRVYASKAHGTHVTGDVALGAVLSLINPGAIGFWLGIGSTVFAAENAPPDLRQMAGFLGGSSLAHSCGVAFSRV